MTQYFLTMPHDSAAEPTMENMDPADFAEVFAAVDAFNTSLRDAGAWVFAGGLQPPSTAKTVDCTGDSPVVADEPFVEAAEYVGGFWIIEAADEAAAVDWATQAASAVQGRIEVRALQEEPPA